MLRSALGNRLLIVGASVFVSLALAICWLKGEGRKGRGRAGWAEVLIYLPLLPPQFAFLYGLNVQFLRLGISGGIGAVIWAQVLFVFPYVMIVLSDPWWALEPRLTRAAASLGAGPLRQLFAVKFPISIADLNNSGDWNCGVCCAICSDGVHGGIPNFHVEDRGSDILLGRGPADHQGLCKLTGNPIVCSVCSGIYGACVCLSQPCRIKGAGQ